MSSWLLVTLYTDKSISDYVTGRFGKVMYLRYWLAEGAQNSYFTQDV